MRCSRVEKYNNRVAIGKERTRHHRRSGWDVRHLQIVDASRLVGPFLLICPSRALSRWKASWLRALPKKVSYFSAVEAWILGSLSLGWSWCSDILLGRPIVLRPQSVLDEDISTTDITIPPILIQGPITRSRARQLKQQVNSFLCSSSCENENRLLPNDVLVLRNEGEGHGVLM